MRTARPAIIIFILSILFVFTLISSAEPYPIAFTAEMAQDGSDTATLEIMVKLPEDVHITSEFLDMALFLPDGVETIRKDFRESLFHQGQVIYRGTTYFSTLVSFAGFKQKQVLGLQGSIKYQICEELPFEQCLPPVERFFKADLRFDQDNQAISVLSFEETRGIQESNETAEPVRDGVREEFSGDVQESRLQRALSRNIVLALFFVFIAGVLTSLTPCVYPMIPITIAVFSNNSSSRRYSSFFKSLVYVLGLSLTYSVLGLVSGMTGVLFGSISQHPVFIITVSAVLFLMALSMFGVFDLHLPASVQDKLSRGRTGGFGGVFVLGMVFGLFAAPCAGPVVITILTYIASTQNPFLGFMLLFIYALGMGIIFIIIGTFSGTLSALPRAGNWMVLVKHFFGYIILFLIVYFASPRLTPETVMLLYAGLMLLLGIFFIREVFSQVGDNTLKNLIVSAGIILIAFAFINMIKAVYPGSSLKSIESNNIEVNWFYELDKGISYARQAGKPYMIYFTAEWCTYCKQMEKTTFTDKALISYLENYEAIKVDLTELNEASQKIMKDYKVQGLPMIIIYHSSGLELERLHGYVGHEQLLSLLKRLNIIG